MNQQALTDILERAAKAWNVPGASCAVWSEGELVKAATGVLSTRTEHAVRPDSLFQIGSISKVLTASLVMILRDRGLVDLDETVRTYLPTFRIADLAASQSITVRQLLNHTSGIGGDFFRNTGLGPDRLDRYLQACNLLPLCHPVGGGFSYSNAAYNIAGALIEAVSGLSFDQTMKQWLFAPLGLENSIVDPLDAPGRSVSTGHTPNPEKPDQYDPVDNIYLIGANTAPAGATIMMSTADLVAFANMHLNHGKAANGEQVMSAESVAEMQEISVTIPVPQRDISDWGLGWLIASQGERTVFGHDGGTIGQYSFLRIHKPTGTIVTLLTNGGSANDCMFEVFSKTLEPLTGFRHSPPIAPTSEAPKDLSKYVGRFETVATKTEFWIENGQLMRSAVMTLDELELPEPTSALVYAGNDTFLHTPKGSARPALVTFMDPDERSVPQKMFYGLRVARRVRPL